MREGQKREKRKERTEEKPPYHGPYEKQALSITNMPTAVSKLARTREQEKQNPVKVIEE